MPQLEARDRGGRLQVRARVGRDREERADDGTFGVLGARDERVEAPVVLAEDDVRRVRGDAHDLAARLLDHAAPLRADLLAPLDDAIARVRGARGFG